MMEIHLYIRQARKNAGLSQVELAKKIKVSQPHVSNLETGEKPPSLEMLERIAKATDCEFIIGFVPIQTYPEFSRILSGHFRNPNQNSD